MKDLNRISALGNIDVTNKVNIPTFVDPDIDYLENDENTWSGSIGSYAGYELSFTQDFSSEGGRYRSFIPTQKPQKVMGVSEEFGHE